MIHDLAGGLTPPMAVVALWCLTSEGWRGRPWVHWVMAVALLGLLGRYL